MIQRIQSIYFLIAAILLSLFLVMPYAEIALENNEAILFHSYDLQKIPNGDTAEMVRQTLPLSVLALITGMISLLNIFLYRKRRLQMRFCGLAMFMLILQLALIYLYHHDTISEYGTFMPSFRLPALFPVICLILIMMAYRAIRHDETLVKSYDRIR